MFGESISALLSDNGDALPRNVQINLKEDIVALLSSSDTTVILVMITLSLQPHCKDMSCIHKHGSALEDIGRVLDVKSFCHIYGRGFAITLGGRLYDGSKLVVLEHGFEPHAFLQAIIDYEVCFSSLKYQVESPKY